MNPCDLYIYAEIVIHICFAELVAFPISTRFPGRGRLNIFKLLRREIENVLFRV